jgi:hypothetical protein
VDRVEIHSGANLEGESLYAIATASKDTNCFDVKVVDRAGTVYVQLTGYHTAALPVSVDREWLMKLHEVAA